MDITFANIHVVVQLYSIVCRLSFIIIKIHVQSTCRYMHKYAEVYACNLSYFSIQAWHCVPAASFKRFVGYKSARNFVAINQTQT